MEVLTDFPERFAQRRELSALFPAGERRKLQLLELWEHKGRLVMKFAGIDSIDDASGLTGCELQILAAERAPLETGSAYVGDLVGSRVFATHGSETEAELGNVSDVIFGAGSAPLLVIEQERAGKKRELMVPFAEAYLVELDTQNKRVRMALPEGMLTLDAPLTAEEKQDQQRKH